VKYISSAPGTRMLTLPCPLAEIAPLATTEPAVWMTWSTRCCSMRSLLVKRRGPGATNVRPRRPVMGLIVWTAVGSGQVEASSPATISAWPTW
jgi:hypothetical protein